MGLGCKTDWLKLEMEEESKIQIVINRTSVYS